LKKEDGGRDWSCRAAELHCRIRGFHPWPGTFTSLEGRTLKILRARLIEVADGGETAPGTLVDVGPAGLVVACGDRSQLLVTEVQPESRRPMPAPAFAAGARLAPGQRFA
jgi:methionyl-tRNA formyltransferase